MENCPPVMAPLVLSFSTDHEVPGLINDYNAKKRGGMQALRYCYFSYAAVMQY